MRSVSRSLLPFCTSTCLAAVLSAVAVLNSAALAQNVIKNHNFEDSTTSLAPWKFYNAANLFNPRVLKAKVGFPEGGADHVFAASALRPWGGDIGLEQSFKISQQQSGKDWWFGAVVTNPNYAWRGSTRYTITISRQIGSIWRDELRTTPTVTTFQSPIQATLKLPAGDYRVRFSVSASSVPKGRDFYIDDCVVRPVRLPVPLFNTYRSGSMEYFNMRLPGGDPRVVSVLYLSLQRLSKPIKIPGFGGYLELDPFRDGGLFQVAAGSGSWSRVFDRRRLALVGRTLYFQVVEANPLLKVLRFGSRTAWFE